MTPTNFSKSVENYCTSMFINGVNPIVLNDLDELCGWIRREFGVQSDVLLDLGGVWLSLLNFSRCSIECLTYA